MALAGLAQLFNPNIISTDKMIPQRTWVAEDNGITLVYAIDWIGSEDRLVLPRGLSHETITFIQWAYEAGHMQGNRRGKDFVRGEIKRALEI